MSIPQYATAISDVPDLRLGLLDRWRPGRPWAALLLRRPETQRQMPTPESQVQALSGALYWVSTEFWQVIAAMAQEVSPETRLEDVPLPVRTDGLIVFEHQGAAVSTVDGSVSPLGAISFAKRRMVYRDVEQEEPAEGLMFCPYGVGDHHGQGPKWAPMGKEGWAFGEAISDLSSYGRPGDVGLSAFFAAFCSLIQQELGLVEVEDQDVDRRSARGSRRAGLPSMVRVVQLRKAAHREGTGEGHGDVEWSHRWLVKGHMRLARVGPQRSERRLVYVRPHVKGPEGRPLIVKETVNAVVR